MYEPPKLIGSVRLTLAIFAFFATFFNFYFLIGFSMSLVCMMEQPEYQSWDDKLTLSLLTSASSYGTMAAALIGGWIADRFGQKWPMSISMFVSMLCMTFIPLLAPLHWGAVVAARSIQGVAAGIAMVIVYDLFTVWGSAEEIATLMAITYAGIPLANIVAYPATAALCLIPVMDGWQMTFFVPSALLLVWWLLHVTLTADSPAKHPRISGEELEHLRNHAIAKHEKAKFPLVDILKSIPIYALLLIHFAISWIYYLIALNIPVYVEETFDVSVLLVSYQSDVTWRFSNLLTRMA